MSLPALKRQLALEAPESVPDGAGGFLTTWTELGRMWAEVSPGTGRIRGQGEAYFSRVPLTITVRAAPVGSEARPLAGQRFREGNRLFAITAVTERDPYGLYLTCFAEEEVVT